MEKRESRIYRWRREGVEQRLLEIAAHLILTRGPDRVSLALVARAAGVSRATAYNYFGDQRGLLTKFSAHRFQELQATLDGVLAQHKEPHAQLQALLREAVTFLEHYSQFFRIIVREQADVVFGSSPDGLTEAISEGMEQYVERLTVPLRAGMREKLFVGQDPARMAWAIAGMVIHAVLRILQKPTSATRTAEVEIMENIIFHAVLVEPTLASRSASPRPQAVRPVSSQGIGRGVTHA